MAEPLPPVSSYVGYSIEEPWGRPRVVFGVDAEDAERLAALLQESSGPAAPAVGAGDEDERVPGRGGPAGGLGPAERGGSLLDDVRGRIPVQGWPADFTEGRDQRGDGWAAQHLPGYPLPGQGGPGVPAPGGAFPGAPVPGGSGPGLTVPGGPGPGVPVPGGSVPTPPVPGPRETADPASRPRDADWVRPRR